MDYFIKYKQAKSCLYCMVAQFLDTYLKLNDLKKYGIDYSIEDIDYKYDIVGNYLNLCFHNFESEGLLAWHYLGIKKPFITYEEIWNMRLNVKNEIMDDNIDYEEMYLKISILLIDMVIRYYRTTISIGNVDDDYIEYNVEDDIYNNEIYACHHMFESAGENIWSFFKIEKPYVGRSVFYKMRNEYTKKLLEEKCEKVKKIEKI